MLYDLHIYSMITMVTVCTQLWSTATSAFWYFNCCIH